MPATCVPQYVPRANTGLSKHGDPVFPHFWSWNQNVARVCARGVGGNCNKPPKKLIFWGVRKGRGLENPSLKRPFFKSIDIDLDV